VVSVHDLPQQQLRMRARGQWKHMWRHRADHSVHSGGVRGNDAVGLRE
jgi:hypothetical protein